MGYDLGQFGLAKPLTSHELLVLFSFTVNLFCCVYLYVCRQIKAVLIAVLSLIIFCVYIVNVHKDISNVVVVPSHMESNMSQKRDKCVQYNPQV